MADVMTVDELRVWHPVEQAGTQEEQQLLSDIIARNFSPEGGEVMRWTDGSCGCHRHWDGSIHLCSAHRFIYEIDRAEPEVFSVGAYTVAVEHRVALTRWERLVAYRRLRRILLARELGLTLPFELHISSGAVTPPPVVSTPAWMNRYRIP